MQRNSHAQAQVQTHDPHLLHEDDFSAVEMSGQYSMGNIVAYRSMDPSSMPTEVLTVESLPLSHDDAPFPAPAYDMSYDSSGRPITPLPRPTVHRVRVSSYSHATPLAHDIEASLIRGGKLLLELPDEPSAVACLLSALGHASSKLQAAGLATALDPVYDTAAFLHGNGNGGGSGASSALSSMDQPGPRSSAASAHGNASNGSGGSPSASHDGHPACRRHVESGYSLCARAVPIPPPSAAPTAGYTVGTSIGQEVVRAGPSTNVHALLPALLRAILRDGLVTVRCNWIDEDIVLESWSDEDEAPGDFVTAAAAAATARQAASASAAPPRPQVPMPSPMDYPDGGDLVAAVTAAVAAQAAVTAAAAASAHTSTHIAHGHAHGSGSGGPSPLSSGSWSPTSSFERDLPAGSLVSVPCVLRAIFKLDRQLRGLDLGGLVVLPHSFSTRSARGSNAPMLHLDVVIA
ncbi:hypothetical protein HYH03_014010 [Edaphochlamys debaryana]|uniref:Uncharacterized protein n=1 Tax=Edaphochlamys debaryana TaxID=47281 RepID=A0A835XNS3_9CHLO|nr:hypothetical protein HYH03_014010 [Edaphochlamys debaryana]|eukprot:KAG2487443.1 hypothetical protein HYH03_014010 [Edaphochlamys debaryana]